MSSLHGTLIVHLLIIYLSRRVAASTATRDKFAHGLFCKMFEKLLYNLYDILVSFLAAEYD
jgi:hypothetical protein